MKQLFKLVILDYDGTMVGSSGVITKKVTNAIRKTVKKGVKVSISTGRTVYSLKNLIKDLHLDVPHVFLAGALVYNPLKDVLLLEEAIDKSFVFETADFALQKSLYMEVSTKENLYYNLPITHYLERRKKMTGEPISMADFKELAEREKILCMRFILDDEDKKKLFKKFQRQMSDKLNFQIGYPFNEPGLEVVNMTNLIVSKVSALRHLCQYFHISPQEVIAVGDSPIDLPLIENAGLGIAMGNAPKDVKDKAKWIAPDVEQNGVEVALEKFILAK